MRRDHAFFNTVVEIDPDIRWLKHKADTDIIALNCQANSIVKVCPRSGIITLGRASCQDVHGDFIDPVAVWPYNITDPRLLSFKLGRNVFNNFLPVLLIHCGHFLPLSLHHRSIFQIQSRPLSR